MFDALGVLDSTAPNLMILLTIRLFFFGMKKRSWRLCYAWQVQILSVGRILFADADPQNLICCMHTRAYKWSAGGRKKMKAFCNFLSGYCDSTLDVK